MTLETLKLAIENRSSISFNYNKPGKVSGKRTGNPHAIFVMTKKDGSKPTMVHIVQTGGVSDSGQDFPSFRMFDLTELSNVELVDNSAPFSIHEDYNHDWDGYNQTIAKV